MSTLKKRLSNKPSKVSLPTKRLEEKKLGRKRDPTRDIDILNAALEVLAEQGFEGMTMGLIAERASAGKGALYRRWASKEDLVIDAVAHMKRSQVDLDNVPDTGTIRGDMLALFKPQSIKVDEKKLKVMAGLTSLILQHPNLSEVGTAAIVEPWAKAHRLILERGIQRGTVTRSIDLETLSNLIPSMAAFRAIVLRKPFDKDFLVSLIDGVLLPALGLSPTSEANHKPR